MENNHVSKTKENNLKAKRLYIAIWRWHFYAGIIFAPIIILLAITGGLYLFKPQIEASIYDDFYYVKKGEQQVPASEQIERVRNDFPNAMISSFKPSYGSDRTAEIGMVNKHGESASVFVNPYHGNVVGTINDNDRMMAAIKGIHNGELWGGKVGNRLIELVACWAIILVVTGVYLWWPRKRKTLFGTLIPRFRSLRGKRLFWRDMHAVTAFWFSLFIMIMLFSGLMWSGVWGGMVNNIVSTTSIGSPVGDQPFEKFAYPESTVPTKEVADVPWAAQNLPVPSSNSDRGQMISVEKVKQIAADYNVHPGYQIMFPEDKTGVYTVYLDPAEVYPNQLNPQTQKTLHLDQYSGEVLENYGWSDYGWLGKVITLGIAFHQGEFGLINQLFNLVLVFALIIIPVSGLVMWWKRKPEGKIGAPELPKKFTMAKGVTVIVIAFGLFFPLVGISLLLVWLLDWLFLKRIPLFHG
ncbi:PepSY-associated TM helix domain-containing protein [Virgibacillus ainsalahensis]